MDSLPLPSRSFCSIQAACPWPPSGFVQREVLVPGLLLYLRHRLCRAAPPLPLPPSPLQVHDCRPHPPPHPASLAGGPLLGARSRSLHQLTRRLEGDLFPGGPARMQCRKTDACYLYEDRGWVRPESSKIPTVYVNKYVQKRKTYRKEIYQWLTVFASGVWDCRWFFWSYAILYFAHSWK